MHGFIYVSGKSPYTIGLIIRCFKRRTQRIRPMMETKWKMERRHYSGTSQTGNWALSLAPRLLIPPRLRSTVPYHRAPSLELRASHQLTSRCRVSSRSSPPSRLPPPLLFSATTMATRSAGRCSASAQPYSNSKPSLSPCWACTLECTLWGRSSTEAGPSLRKSIIGALLRWSVDKSSNSVAPFQSFLSSQFTSIRPLLTSSPALHLLYATGRRNLLCLHITITLYPLHDIPGLIYNFVKGIIEPTFDSSEGLVFDATLGMGVDGLQDGVGVWAVVEKSFMRDLRQKRWDLVSTLHVLIQMY